MKKILNEPPSIADVAKLAGVSIATVSRVINNSKPVNDETRQKVEKAIKECRYLPNLQARGLVKKQTRMIGAIFPDLRNDAFMNSLTGISQALREKDYHLLLCNTFSSSEAEVEYIQLLQEQRVDGIILSATRFSPSHIEALNALTVPMVVIAQPVPSEVTKPIANWLANTQQAAEDAVHYLYQKGHRRISFVSSPLWDHYSGYLRLEGYCKAMTELGLPIDSGHLLGTEFNSHEGGEKAAARIYRVGNMPTAILCSDDMVALGMIAYFQKVGLSIPKDISIMGLDNKRAGHLLHPYLTTMGRDSVANGQRLARYLIETIETGHYPEPLKQMGTIRLIERESVTALNSKV